MRYMGKIYLLIAIVLLFFFNLFKGQNLSNYDLLPPSPSAYKFSLHNKVYDATSTGEFNYNLPLFNIEYNGFNFPITVNYVSGLSLNDIGGDLGVSWELYAGGVITRVIRDEADENSPRWLPEYIDFKRNDLIKINSAASGQKLDTEYDPFYFKLPNGDSGTFYIDENMNILHNSSDGYDIKIYKIIDNSIIGELSYLLKFVLLDNKGNQYIFGGTLNSTEYTVYSSSSNQGSHTPLKKRGQTAWYLTNVSSKNNISISYEYDKRRIEYYSNKNANIFLSEKCNCEGDSVGENYLYSESKEVGYVEQNRPQIKYIKYSTFVVSFLYDKKREDLISSEGGLLTDIIFENRLANHKIKHYTFEYKSYTTPVEGYYSGGNYETRYFLSKVQEKLSNELYSFNYYKPEDLPSRFSLSSDYYGYYNGYSNTTPFSKINNKNVEDYVSFSVLAHRYIPGNQFSANKEVNPQTVFYGAISEVILPNKGRISVYYESNQSTGEFNVEESDKKELKVKRMCREETIKSKSLKIVSNGSDINFSTGSSIDNYNCGSPDPLHDKYYLTFTNLTTGQIIRSISRRIGENITSSNEKCFGYVGEECPIKTVANNEYEITLEVSSKFSEVYAGVSLDYNKRQTQKEEVVNHSGYRVNKVLIKDDVSNSVETKFYYNEIKDKDSLKTTIQNLNIPYFYRKYFIQKNCIDECGCLNKAREIDKNICINDVLQKNPSLQKKNYIYTSYNLQNFYNNTYNKPFYSVVTEVIENNSATEKKFILPNAIAPVVIQGTVIPNIPYSDIRNSFGILEGEKYYMFDNGVKRYKIIKEVNHGFENFRNNSLKNFYFRQDYPTPPRTLNSHLYIDNISISEYRRHLGRFRKKSLTIIDYLNENRLITTTQYHYGVTNHYQPTSQTTTFPDGTTQTTEYDYAHEKGNQYLIDKNMVGIPLETRVSKNGKLISKVETVYPSSQTEANTYTEGLPMPKETRTLDLDVPSKNHQNITYTKYDNKGNLLEYKINGITPVAIVWGYNQTQPIAKIEGVGYDYIKDWVLDMVQKSDQDKDTATEQTLLQALNAFRDRDELKNFQVTTYTYDPLVGVTSITTPSGITEYYKYDAANRLEKVVDADNKVLKEYKYNYKQ